MINSGIATERKSTGEIARCAPQWLTCKPLFGLHCNGCRCGAPFLEMSEMQRGTIVRTGAKGYGFIQPVDEGRDVFFHVRASGCIHFEIGDKVLFELNQFAARRGKREACEVRRIP